MDISGFVDKAVAQDARNYFSEYAGSLDGIPDFVKDFYRRNNPVDVEVEINGATIWMIPAEKLEEVRLEYPELGEQFIFATSNGDPIFLHNGSVYTCAHGVSQADWEKLADNIESFFSEM